MEFPVFEIARAVTHVPICLGESIRVSISGSIQIVSAAQEFQATVMRVHDISGDIFSRGIISDCDGFARAGRKETQQEENRNSDDKKKMISGFFFHLFISLKSFKDVYLATASRCKEIKIQFTNFLLVALATWREIKSFSVWILIEIPPGCMRILRDEKG